MLKIKDNVDLKELEKFGFKQIIKYERRNGDKAYYPEKSYILDDRCNIIEILEERVNSDWKHQNNAREIYVYESDYEMGVSMNQLDVIYDLIKAGLVEKSDGNE